MGFEYEMLKRLAKYLDVELEIIVAEDHNELVDMLNRGEGDLIAYAMTITQQRQAYIDFTDYLYLTQQVLVQRKPDNWQKMSQPRVRKATVNSTIDLIGDTVAVRQNTAYFERLQNLEDEVGGDIYIDTVEGNVPEERIIRQVAQKQRKYTVADENIAELNASYYPNLDVETPISFSQRIAWGVRKNSPELRQAINKWLKRMKRNVTYYVLYNKYFEAKHQFRARIKSDFYSLNSGKISQYDPKIKQYAQTIGWDWRFLSSLIYQESRFRPTARSWAGARGLMQLMPATARELGVRNSRDPDQNLRGGTKYLKQLFGMWEEIPDSITRLKFTIASYNCGFYHVKDAQRLTKKFGGDPLKWEDNVAKNLLRLSYRKYYNDPVVKYGYCRGIEPTTYVRQIFQRYKHYKELIPEEEPAKAS
jgi:membrane-bound lytic murein transglycosylase F